MRTVTDLPVVDHPRQLRVRIPRYRCENTSCEREVFRHNVDRLARAGGPTTRRCARHILRRLMLDRTSIAAIARELGLSWDTVNAIVVEATTGPALFRDCRLQFACFRAPSAEHPRWPWPRRVPGRPGLDVLPPPAVWEAGRQR